MIELEVGGDSGEHNSTGTALCFGSWCISNRVQDRLQLVLGAHNALYGRYGSVAESFELKSRTSHPRKVNAKRGNSIADLLKRRPSQHMNNLTEQDHRFFRLSMPASNSRRLSDTQYLGEEVWRESIEPFKKWQEYVMKDSAVEV